MDSAESQRDSLVKELVSKHYNKDKCKCLYDRPDNQMTTKHVIRLIYDLNLDFTTPPIIPDCTICDHCYDFAIIARKEIYGTEMEAGLFDSFAFLLKYNACLMRRIGKLEDQLADLLRKDDSS